MQTKIIYAVTLLLCITAIAAYEIKPNPDNGDFTIFPVADLGASAFPTSMAFASDGRIFIGQKNGIIRVVDSKGNLQAQPWIDLSDRVNNAGDKGLTSIALHPQFPTQPYIYLTYPVWQSDSRDLNRVTQGVVARYTETNGVGSVASQLLLIGRINGTGFPSCHNSHVTGDLLFGTDGTLFASAGEGSHWDSVDDGVDDRWAIHDWECSPFFGAENDIGSFRAQSMTSLGGRVIRMDPLTGNGIGSSNFPALVANPFFDASKPASPASLTWAYGFRNPWKLSLVPGSPAPGTLYISDVGAKDYEEINVVAASDKGANYGWPCQSGMRRPQPWFTNTATPTEYYVPRYPTAQSVVDRCKALEPSLTNTHTPVFYYSRSQYVFGEKIGVIGNCASGLSFYSGNSYPSLYNAQNDGSRALFISDFGNQWIKVIRVDANNNYIPSAGVQDFLDNVGAITFLAASPYNGDLYYLTQYGSVDRIRYTVGYVGAPIVQAEAFPSSLNIANRPATIQFSADGTFDAAGLDLEFLWNFGDGTTSNQPNPSHTYTKADVFTVTLTVKNSGGYTGTVSTRVATNNDLPQVKISGANWFEFNDRQSVTLTAQFSDDITPASQLTWQWDYGLIHNNHLHPKIDVDPTNGVASGATGSTTRVLTSLISIYERNVLEITATVYDANGASSKATVIGVPNLPGNANYGNSAPVAAFTAEQRGSSVYFDGGLSTDSDVDLLDFTWNWGDGTTGTGMVTRHTYPHNGVYTVTLTVKDPWRATSSKTMSFDYKSNIMSSTTSTQLSTTSTTSTTSTIGQDDTATSSTIQTPSTTSEVVTPSEVPNAETTETPAVTVERPQGAASTTTLCVFVALVAVLVM